MRQGRQAADLIADAFRPFAFSIFHLHHLGIRFNDCEGGLDLVARVRDKTFLLFVAFRDGTNRDF